MPVPAGFPSVVSVVAQQSTDSNGVGRLETLEFSSTVYYQVLADQTAGVLKAYKSTDGGLTWTLKATGPSIKLDDASVQPNSWQNFSVVVDPVGKKLYAIYWSATPDLAAVTFDGATESLGSVHASGYVPLTGSFVGGQQNTPIQAVYRAADNKVVVCVGNSISPGGVAPYQVIKAKLWAVGAGWSSIGDLGNADTATHNYMNGGIAINAATGHAYAFLFDFLPLGTGTCGFYMQAIHADNSLGACQTINTAVANRPFSNPGQPWVDSLGVICQTYQAGPNSTSVAHIIRGAVGDAPAWNDETPAFFQPDHANTNYFPSTFIEFNGSQMLIYAADDASGLNFSYALSTVGSTNASWSSTGTAIGSYLFTDPGGMSGFPGGQAMSTQAIISTGIDPTGSTAYGQAFFGFASIGPPPITVNLPIPAGALVITVPGGGVQKDAGVFRTIVLPDPNIVCCFGTQRFCNITSKKQKYPIKRNKTPYV